MNINEIKEKYAVNTADEAIEMIVDLGHDYDGFSDKKDLKSLIDELVELAVLAKNLMHASTADAKCSVDIHNNSNNRVVNNMWFDTLVKGRIYELKCYPVTELVKDPDMIQKGKLETIDYRKTKDPNQVQYINGIPRTIYDKYVEGVKAECLGTGYFITLDSPPYCIEKEFVYVCKIAYEEEKKK